MLSHLFDYRCKVSVERITEVFVNIVIKCIAVFGVFAEHIIYLILNIVTDPSDSVVSVASFIGEENKQNVIFYST